MVLSKEDLKEEIKKIELQLLKPLNSALDVRGSILYSTSHRVWNTIKIKRNIIQEFPSLREKRTKFAYRMVLHRSYQDLEKLIRKMKRTNEAIPILLFLYKEKSNEFQ